MTDSLLRIGSGDMLELYEKHRYSSGLWQGPCRLAFPAQTAASWAVSVIFTNDMLPDLKPACSYYFGE